VFDAIVAGAATESPLWGDAVRPEHEQLRQPVFSVLASDRHAVGLETIYEGYLVHYGRSRLFGPPDRDTALLLGDYLYAHGLVRIAATGDVKAVSELAELISRCAHLRAEGLGGDGEAWATTSLSLGDGGPAGVSNEAVRDALAAHARLVG
jgi:hypothetical protein